jgi:hypothetical protein
MTVLENNIALGLQKCAAFPQMISATAFKIDSGGQNIPLIVMKNNRWKA